MSITLAMEAELKNAWDLVQAETNLILRQNALRVYKKKLAVYLRHKLFIATMEKKDTH